MVEGDDGFHLEQAELGAWGIPESAVRPEMRDGLLRQTGKSLVMEGIGMSVTSSPETCGGRGPEMEPQRHQHAWMDGHGRR